MTKTKLSQIISSALAKHLVLKYVKFCQTDPKLMRYCINRKVSNKTNKRNFDKVFKRKLAQYSNFKSDFIFNLNTTNHIVYFMLDPHSHKLMLPAKAAQSILSQTSAILNGGILKDSRLRASLDVINLSNNIKYNMPLLLRMRANENGNLEFMLCQIARLDIVDNGTEQDSYYLIENDCLDVLESHYIFMTTGSVKVFNRFVNGMLDYKHGYDLRSDKPIDFIQSDTNSIINRLTNSGAHGYLKWCGFAYADLYKFANGKTSLAYNWQDPVTGFDPKLRYSYRSFDSVEIGTGLPYTYLLRNYQINSFEDLLCGYWKRLVDLRGQINFDKLAIAELGQLSGLFTKLTKREAISAAKWYLHNRFDLIKLPKPNVYADIYAYYLMDVYHVPARISKNINYLGLFTAQQVRDLLKYYKVVTNKKFEHNISNVWIFVKNMNNIILTGRRLDANCYNTSGDSLCQQDYWQRVRDNVAGRNYVQLWDTENKLDYYIDVFQVFAEFDIEDLLMYTDEECLIDVYLDDQHYIAQVNYNINHDPQFDEFYIKYCYLAGGKKAPAKMCHKIARILLRWFV